MNEHTKKKIRKEVFVTQVYCQKKLDILNEERSEQEFNNNQTGFGIAASEPIEISAELKNKITLIEAKQRDLETWKQNVENIITSGNHDGYELQAVQIKSNELKKDIKTILGEDEQ